MPKSKKNEGGFRPIEFTPGPTTPPLVTAVNVPTTPAGDQVPQTAAKSEPDKAPAKPKKES